MTLFAYGEGALRGRAGDGLLHGLKLVAVAIVAQAVMGMAQSLAPDRPRATIAVLSLILMAFAPAAWAQIAVIVLGGLAGLVVCRRGRGHRRPRRRRADHAADGDRFRRSVFRASGALLRSGRLGRGGAGRRLLSVRGAGVRRRACGAAAASRRRCRSGLGLRQRFPCGLRRRPGRAGAFVHVCGLSRRCRQCAARRRGRGGARARCDLRARDFCS